MDKIINTGLIMNPYNWIIVFLMVSIGAIGVATLTPEG